MLLCSQIAFRLGAKDPLKLGDFLHFDFGLKSVQSKVGNAGKTKEDAVGSFVLWGVAFPIRNGKLVPKAAQARALGRLHSLPPPYARH